MIEINTQITRETPLMTRGPERRLSLLLWVIFVLFLAALTARLVFDPAGAQAHEAQATVWLYLHLVTVTPAIPLALYLLSRPKGTTRHRLLGRLWCGLMVITALAALMIRGYFLPNWNGINPIHVFSVLTLLGVPRIVMAARAHKVEAHRRAVLGLTLGGLFFAGLFAFLPGRLLGQWLFGALA